jgi:hypothetical protein
MQELVVLSFHFFAKSEQDFNEVKMKVKLELLTDLIIKKQGTSQHTRNEILKWYSQ